MKLTEQLQKKKDELHENYQPFIRDMAPEDAVDWCHNRPEPIHSTDANEKPIFVDLKSCTMLCQRSAGQTAAMKKSVSDSRWCGMTGGFDRFVGVDVFMTMNAVCLMEVTG